jgi:hypothetical protein
MKIADAFVLISKDDSPLKRGLVSTRKDIEGWTNSVGGIIQNALGFSLGQAFTSTVQGILGSIKQLGKGLIGGNDQFEQYQTRFSVLLGSMDKAKERIAELAHFGATTPFDLPGVVEADTILQAFGFHAEETKNKFGFAGDEIRRIAGDVASGAGASFQEIALNLGKFSSGATGEAMMRFQEMGIVTRETLRGMGIEFSKSGELMSPLPQAMTAILTVMQEKYGGMMAAQSSTFSGMMSNLRDWVDGALRLMGGPTFDILKDQLKDLLAFLNSGVVTNALNGFRDLFAGAFAGIVATVRGMTGVILAAFRGMFGDVGGNMQEFANNAFDWGANIGTSFAEGIYAAAGAVIDALSYLGSLIAYWLMPGSPPKLLPNLDKWGTGAADAWLEGWTKADFGMLDDLAGMIENALGSLDLDEGEQLSGLVAAREAIKAAIVEINSMGSISEQTLAKITAEAGNLAGPIGAYAQDLAEVARRTKEVEAAQERVNRVTEKYDAILSPLREQLQGIRDQEYAFRNEQERARLQEILASATAGEREKEQARLALQRLDIEEEITGVEKEKNKELSAAEKQLKEAQDGLDMAEKRLDLSKAYIDQLTEENELLQQQKKLLEDIGGGGGSGGAKPKGAGGMSKPGLPAKPSGPSIFDRLNEALNGGEAGSIQERIAEMTGKIAEMYKELEQKSQKMGETWAKVWGIFDKFVVTPIKDFLDSQNGQLLISILEKIALVIGGAALINGTIKLAGAFLGLFTPVTLLVIALGALIALLNDPRIQSGLASWGENAKQFGMIYDQMIQDFLKYTASGLTEQQQAFLLGVEGWFAQLVVLGLLGFLSMGAAIGGAMESMSVAVTTWIIGIVLDIIAKISELKAKWKETWSGIADNAKIIWDSLKERATTWIGEVKTTIATKVDELKTEWQTKWTEIKEKGLELLQALIDALPEKLTTLAGDIKTAIDGLITDLAGKVSEWEGIGKSFIQGIIDGASSLAGNLVSAVVQMVLDAVGGAANAIMSHSPSKLTHNVLGKPMGEGVIGGWEDSMKNAQAEMAKTLVNAIPTPDMVGAGGYGDSINTYVFNGNRDPLTYAQDIRQSNDRRRQQGRLTRR